MIEAGCAPASNRVDAEHMSSLSPVRSHTILISVECTISRELTAANVLMSASSEKTNQSCLHSSRRRIAAKRDERHRSLSLFCGATTQSDTRSDRKVEEVWPHRFAVDGCDPKESSCSSNLAALLQNHFAQAFGAGGEIASVQFSS